MATTKIPTQDAGNSPTTPAKARPGKPSANKNLGPLNLQQELTLFGKWVGDSIWVPPKENSQELAKSLLNQFGPFSSRERCWAALEKQHRDKFTHVREIELPASSIRLPQGRLFVSVTNQKDFDKIEEPIPRCVQMRLDEFLEGRGKQRGVRVYYLKPLCIEKGNQLIFTTRDQIDHATNTIQKEVFTAYRRMYPWHLAKRVAAGAINTGLAIPRALVNSKLEKKRREIHDFHQRLEFERRQRAWMTVQAHRACRTHGCEFDEILSLTDPPKREDVIEHFVEDTDLSPIGRKMFMIASAATLPWFATLAVGFYQLFTVTTVTSVTVCDPVFVAEMPGARGELLKIGHFDEVDGVMHVEI